MPKVNKIKKYRIRIVDRDVVLDYVGAYATGALATACGAIALTAKNVTLAAFSGIFLTITSYFAGHGHGRSKEIKKEYEGLIKEIETQGLTGLRLWWCERNEGLEKKVKYIMQSMCLDYDSAKARYQADMKEKRALYKVENARNR